MICALCKQNEADKKNTHFLTDGIIRNCLNMDGSNEREKGLYFDLSTGKSFIDFNFQRETTVHKLEESLGRKVTQEEIDKAKVIPFSVDYFFCTACEQIFTEIESRFIAEILPNFRNVDLSEISSLSLNDIKLIRLFFYLQVWRTSVCDETVTLSDSVSEEIREIIFKNKTLTPSQLNHYPISVTYLQTSGGAYQYTTNYVGFSSDRNPNIIFLNDFIIQFFETYESIRFLDFHGLNSEDLFEDSINLYEERFLFNVFNNAKRKTLLRTLITAEKVKKTISDYSQGFRKLWWISFGRYPTDEIVQEYLNIIVGESDFYILKYTKENILELTMKFIQQRM